MRGDDFHQAGVFSYISPEERVPQNHPLRPIREMVDEVLVELSPDFDRLYARTGRPSVAPEQLLRALLLQIFYTIRSERLLMEHLEYNLLYRWFVGLNMDDPVWDATTFSKNRHRLISGQIAQRFFARVLAQARARGLLSDEHFTVDSTLVEAYASLKSLRRKDGDEAPPPDDPGNPTVTFRGERRSNATHGVPQEPEARLARRGPGREAKLAYQGHVLMENRHGLAVAVEVSEATGTAERDVGLALARRMAKRRRRVTLGADKAYDSGDFVTRVRRLRITPHVAQNTSRRASAVDGRTTRHPGYEVSQRIRKRVEEIFGWLKTVGPLRKLRHRGTAKARWTLIFATAIYNLIRIRTLTEASA